MATQNPIVSGSAATATNGGDDHETFSTAEGLMSIDQLASYTGNPKNTLYYWRAQGSGPRGMKLGKYVRYRRADVQTWLDASVEQGRKSW